MITKGRNDNKWSRKIETIITNKRSRKVETITNKWSRKVAMRNIHRSRNFYTPRYTAFVHYFTTDVLSFLNGTPFAAECVSALVSACPQTTHLLYHEGPAEERHIFCRWIPVCSYTGWRPNPCACNSNWGVSEICSGTTLVQDMSLSYSIRRSPIAALWHFCVPPVCLQLDTREDCSLAGIQHVAYTNEAVSTNGGLKYKHSIFNNSKIPELHQVQKIGHWKKLWT